MGALVVAAVLHRIGPARFVMVAVLGVVVAVRLRAVRRGRGALLRRKQELLRPRS